VAVIGAGPAGLEAAVTLTKRGFDVTVFEKSDHMGGKMHRSFIVT
jgi:phytoene dehydrogenase-like protein